MKNVFHTGQQKFLAAKAATGMLMLSVGTQVHAALPTTANPSQAPAQGDYIGLLKGYAYDIALVLGLILGTIAFLVVVNNMIATYNEIGNGKKTWGDMGMHGGMGVLLIVFVVYLLTEAASVIF
jgi:integrating conjugative element membrane protein (TIGR03745 family)